MRVVVIALNDVVQHLLVGDFLARLSQLVEAALRAHLAGGSQVDLHRRVGQHHRADVPAVHDHALAAGDFPLEVDQTFAHRAHGGDLRGGGGGFGRADALGHVLAVEEHALHAVAEFHAQVGRARGLGDGLRAAMAVLGHVQAHGAIHRAGVQIGRVQGLGDGLGDGGFARARGAVDGDGENFLHGRNAPCLLFRGSAGGRGDCTGGDLQPARAGVGCAGRARMEPGGAPAARTASANCRCGAADELPQSGFGGNSSTARGALEGDSWVAERGESRILAAGGERRSGRGRAVCRNGVRRRGCLRKRGMHGGGDALLVQHREV